VKLTISLLAAVLALAPACKGKDDQAATKGGTAAPAEKPLPTCKAGELIQGDACVAVVPGFWMRKNVCRPPIVAPSAKYHAVAGALTPVLA